MISFLNSPSYRYWLGCNPSIALSHITIPVLALNGDLDFIADFKTHLPIILQALRKANNQDVTIKEMSDMNHWFQSCKTGAIAEYGIIDETISPVVLQLVSDWILARNK